MKDKEENMGSRAIARFERAELCMEVLSDFSDSALSSGVVGEMVEFMTRLYTNKPIERGMLESILSKLEANNDDTV